MPQIQRVNGYTAYRQYMADFQRSLRALGTEEALKRVDFSDTYGPDLPKYRRFVALDDNNNVLGCMVMIRSANADGTEVKLKIDTICSHTLNNKGAAHHLVDAAIAQSWQEGLGGRLVLTDESHGAGGHLYSMGGFHYLDVQTGAMARTPEAGETVDNFRELLKPRQALKGPVWLQVLESENNAWEHSNT